MVEFFEEPEDRASGSTMQLGHHRVTLSTMRKGEPGFKDTPLGPRLWIVITDTADRSQSCVTGQTFNANCKGMMASLNKALGFKAAQLSELVSNPGGVTATGFPANDAAKIAAFWHNASAWIEAQPNPGYDSPNIRFLEKEPGTKRGPDDYTDEVVDSGGI